MDFSILLKVIPEASVAQFIDNAVDAELAKVGSLIKSEVKKLLDKAYGTSLAAAQPSTQVLSTSAQPIESIHIGS